jgi:hypothetical protein
MKNLSLYITAGLIIIFISLFSVVVVLGKRLNAANREINRLEMNNAQQIDSTRRHLALILTLKELLSIDTLKIDSLSKALKIRPKTILQYVNVETKVHDTIPKIIKTYLTANGSWWAVDSTKCWSWAGFVNINPDSVWLERKSFVFEDKSESVFFWERERRFLFIHFGKKRYYQKTSSKCSSEKVLVIDVKRK